MIVNVSSVLALVPFSIINAGVQRKQGLGAHVEPEPADTAQRRHEDQSCSESSRPSVGTDLHRDRADPDDDKQFKNKGALTIEELMEEFRNGMEADQDLISAGTGEDMTARWAKEFGEQYIEMGGWTPIRR